MQPPRNILEAYHEQQPIGVRTDDGSKTPAEIAGMAEKTVTMHFPETVTLTISHGCTVTYPAGTHQVPELLSTHWYLKAQGATVQAAE
jgi:hypothetical protein